jgi:hypothetical protein
MKMHGITHVKKLLMFERKIVRKMCDPNKLTGGFWRIKTNEELDKLIKKNNLVR